MAFFTLPSAAFTQPKASRGAARGPAAGDDGLVVTTGLGHGTEAGQAIGDHMGAPCT
jgi:hypothetical protein